MANRNQLTIAYVTADAMCGLVTQAHPWLPCHAGCDGCCKSFAISDDEGRQLKRAFGVLGRDIRTAATRRARAAVREQRIGQRPICPLLNDHQCMVYGDRPIICRLYGRGELKIDDSRFGCAEVEKAVSENGNRAQMIDVAEYYRTVAAPFSNTRRSIAEWVAY